MKEFVVNREVLEDGLEHLILADNFESAEEGINYAKGYLDFLQKSEETLAEEILKAINKHLVNLVSVDFVMDTPSVLTYLKDLPSEEKLYFLSGCLRTEVERCTEVSIKTRENLNAVIKAQELANKPLQDLTEDERAEGARANMRARLDTTRKNPLLNSAEGKLLLDLTEKLLDFAD